jgi:excisionase family DNA binding protein
MDTIINQLVDTPKIEKLLKGIEVARLLNVSRSFAYLLMQTGHIPTVRLGRSIRVRPQDLIEYIDENIHRQKDQP